MKDFFLIGKILRNFALDSVSGFIVNLYGFELLMKFYSSLKLPKSSVVSRSLLSFLQNPYKFFWFSYDPAWNIYWDDAPNSSYYDDEDLQDKITTSI